MALLPEMSSANNMVRGPVTVAGLRLHVDF
jgi:hypothetical protein